MNKLLSGLAVLPFLASMAMAQEPVKLSGQQMDKVTAGWDLVEFDFSNTSQTLIAIYHPGVVPAPSLCSNCYLNIQSVAFSIGSAFGPPR
jgi:hypothetical protein